MGNRRSANVRRAVFLDRDGVLNRAVVRDGRPLPPASFADFELLPGVADAVARIKAAGLLAIVVTNQPDVAGGRQSRAEVDRMHDRLRAELPIDEIRVCWCLEGEDCDCYKPKPGLLLDAAADWNIDLATSFMVGDRWRDVGAGRAAGCTTLFVERGYAERRPEQPDHVVADLGEAAAIILRDLNRIPDGRPVS